MRPPVPSAFLWATTFTMPSVSPRIWARPLAMKRCIEVTTSNPASIALCSVCPAKATSGWQ